jgi:methionyl-tRNA formyltransferase
MRLVFMGTPAFAAVALAEVLAQGHEVVAVYTRAPKPGGRRGLEAVPSPVHALAAEKGLPLFTPVGLRSEEAQAEFRSHAADAAVVVAYGLLLPRPILDAPLRGCLNVHASLLPRWRGAAPIHRAIMAGDRRTGVYVMRMDEGLDTGPVVEPPRSVPIGENETTGEVHDRLAAAGAAALCDALDRLSRGALVFTPQPAEGVLYAPKIDKAERPIDWSRPAAVVHDHIRGLSPFPGATFEAAVGGRTEIVKALRSRLAGGGGEPGAVLDDELTIACGEGAVRLLELQRAGRGRLDARSFQRGARIPAGARLR